MIIQQLVLQATDLAELKSFYTETLGFALSSPHPSPKERELNDSFSIAAGDSKLTFKTTHLIGKKPFYHFAFNIPTNKVEEAVEWLRERGVEPLPIEVENPDDAENPIISDIAEFEDWNARAVYFLDPCGNVVELIARLESKYVSQRPFDAASVISISEIGLACDDAAAYAKQLREKYDITSFQKNTNNTQFWALGADNGLLVLSVKSRQWFPTDRQVEQFPMIIYFKNRKNIDCELEIF